MKGKFARMKGLIAHAGGYRCRMVVPDGIELRRHLELSGRGWHVHLRRGLLLLLCSLPLLALLNAFGQRPATRLARGSAATLEVYAPERVRGGLLYTARFTITARAALQSPRLVLDPGWVEGLQINSITPQPERESSRDGRIVLHLPDLAAGRHTTTFIALQVNPTDVGRHSQTTRLEANGMEPLVLGQTLTVVP